jgi:hypothetical protein
VMAFTDGLGQLWPIIKANPEAMKKLLVWTDQRLKYIELRKLYTVVWSESGSNHRLAEEDTIFAWESFLEACDNEGRFHLLCKECYIIYT